MKNADRGMRIAEYAGGWWVAGCEGLDAGFEVLVVY
jgi:hypothetical protein